jgi:hypothetical protein
MDIQLEVSGIQATCGVQITCFRYRSGYKLKKAENHTFNILYSVGNLDKWVDSNGNLDSVMKHKFKALTEANILMHVASFAMTKYFLV